ncbi:MBL fold metallo-hydrolase [Flavobacteriaceae bacterium]|nr:MBL fold metallo-hydrolase [Flavobacteriaceae bacterium]
MFRILSHATLQVSIEEKSLLVDPWLIGSCYWRSWWNYPPLNNININDIIPSAIYITHVHWDHWHGPTLKKFLDKNVEIITHLEPNERSYKDLVDFGFKNITLLKHGQKYSIGKIKITPYQFGLFLNDSALVIETPNYKILNANDCKIAGASLEQIKNKHKNFDFALRSHSSANDRVCYKIKGSNKVFDDSMHYTRSFKLFMDNVKPKYAIPFASNHCHLHKDVINFNNIINDPFKLKKELQLLGGLKSSKLMVMLAGDSWSSKKGFKINEKNEHYFSDKENQISQYAISVEESLNKYYTVESKLRLNNRVIKVFESQLLSIPKFFKRNLKNWKVCFHLHGGKKNYYLMIDAYNSNITEINENIFNESNSKVISPLSVFSSAVNQNMFHHSGISKRNKYIFNDENNLKKWEILNDLLEKIELGVFPLKLSYLKRLVLNYLLRWREIFVYAKAFILLKKGYKIYDVEEKILEES